MHLNHSRLCSLEEVTGITEAEMGNADLLREPEARQLIYCIAKYPEVLLNAKDTLEPCGIVKHSFQLW